MTRFQFAQVTPFGQKSLSLARAACGGAGGFTGDGSVLGAGAVCGKSGASMMRVPFGIVVQRAPVGQVAVTLGPAA
jgi:hypothetical protein